MTIKYANIEFEVEFEKIDDSFDHEFGTKYQHHYELTSIKIGDSELIELLDSDVVIAIEEKIQQEIDS